MVNILDLVIATGKNSEKEFFEKVERICDKFRVIRDNSGGKISVECDAGEGISFGSNHYIENYKLPRTIWAYSEKEDVFLSYMKYDNKIRPTRFSDRDFSKFSNKIFQKVNESYSKI